MVPLKGDWEQIDQRMLFLTTQLASVEAMGMPTTIRWDKFYGKTADKFFYHPIDRNSSYHTETLLTQRPPQADVAGGEGVPSRQGLDDKNSR